MGFSYVEKGLIGILRAISFVYDVLTYVPYYFIQEPSRKLTDSCHVRAISTTDKPAGPYRCVEESELSTTCDEDCSTLDELFQKAVHTHPAKDCFGHRPHFGEEDEVQSNGKVFKKFVLGDSYVWESYSQVQTRVYNFGSGLAALKQQVRQNILIFAETRSEWLIAAQACFRHNYPVVTLYATLGDEAVVHGINETEVSHVITSGDLLPKFKKLLPRLPKVKCIIYMEGRRPVDGTTVNGGHSVQVLSMEDVEALGAQPGNFQQRAEQPPKPGDVAVIMYTSGSTGLPKGVQLTHANLMAAISGMTARVVGIGPTDTYIGYLPLAHILELAAETACICSGARIGFSSPLTVTDQSTGIRRNCKGDVSILRPTLMACVPTVMDRIYKNVWEKVNESGLASRALFKFAYSYKSSYYERGWDTPLVNQFVLRRIRSLLGGRLRGVLSGGAPLSPDTQRFINVCFCCPVIQGYGLTETCAAGSISGMDDLSSGHVGAPLSCCELKLVEWAEGGYRPTDEPPSGELWVGGPVVALGYYKNPEKTAEDFRVANGQRWFCTGDIATVRKDGCFTIVDRKKDLVKLQAGEYVSLGKVESVLKLCSLVDNVCVYASSLQSYTVALVIPNQKNLKLRAIEKGLDADHFEALCNNQSIVNEVLESMKVTATAGGLEKFEIPQKIKLLPTPWTPDTGLVTESLKLKRKDIEIKFKTVLQKLYN